MKKIYFSVEQAEELIPFLESRVQALRETQEEIAFLDGVKIQFGEETIENDLRVLEVNKRYHALWIKFYEHLEELGRLGCKVKDVERGLVDFLSKWEEEEIFLCWRMGEKKIEYWHTPEAGYSGRKPIRFLAAKAEKL